MNTERWRRMIDRDGQREMKDRGTDERREMDGEKDDQRERSMMERKR